MDINWGTIISLGITLILQACAFVWFLSKMHTELEQVHKALESTKTLPDRVLKLEWETAQGKDSFNEMKRIHLDVSSKLTELNLLIHEMRKDIEHNKCKKTDGHC